MAFKEDKQPSVWLSDFVISFISGLLLYLAVIIYLVATDRLILTGIAFLPVIILRIIHGWRVRQEKKANELIEPLTSLHEGVHKRLYYYLSVDGPCTDKVFHDTFIGCIDDAQNGLYPGEETKDYVEGNPDLKGKELKTLLTYINAPMGRFIEDMERIGSDPSTPYKFKREVQGRKRDGMWIAMR